jgi:hypothetical protein
MIPVSFAARITTDEELTMLVIAVHGAEIAGDRLPWTGRRHDDDGTESTGEATASGLFDAVFHALHDGEQVAIGFDCPLTVPAGANDSADVASLLAEADGVDAAPALAELRRLVGELGNWRPWTIVTTSLPRWRATTSVLLWEAVPAAGAAVDPIAAIEAFFTMVRAKEQPVGDADGPILNLAAAAAVSSEATADTSELTSPVVTVRYGVRPVNATS